MKKFTTEEKKIILETLELGLKEFDNKFRTDYSYGLCGYFNDLINMPSYDAKGRPNYERILIHRYMYANIPPYCVKRMRGNGYFWQPGWRAPRKKFLVKLINQLKAELYEDNDRHRVN